MAHATTLVRRGERWPLWRATVDAGLPDGGGTAVEYKDRLFVQFFFPRPSADEVRELETGRVDVVLLRVSGWLFFAYRVGRIPWHRAPFSALPLDAQRLAVGFAAPAPAAPPMQIVMVDARDGALRGSRGVLAPAAFLTRFVDALADDRRRAAARAVSSSDYRRITGALDSVLPPTDHLVRAALASDLPGVEFMGGFFVHARVRP